MMQLELLYLPPMNLQIHESISPMVFSVKKLLVIYPRCCIPCSCSHFSPNLGKYSIDSAHLGYVSHHLTINWIASHHEGYRNAIPLNNHHDLFTLIRWLPLDSHGQPQAPCSFVAWAKVPYLLAGQAPAIFLWCRPTGRKIQGFSWRDTLRISCVWKSSIFFKRFSESSMLIVKFHCASCCPGSDSIHLLLGLCWKIACIETLGVIIQYSS